MGLGYEIEISGVEFEEALHPARGGLRSELHCSSRRGPPPNIHAGDEVAVLTEVKRPQVFMDEGAFDRRAYLAKQNNRISGYTQAPDLQRDRLALPTIGTFRCGETKKISSMRLMGYLRALRKLQG